MWYCDGFFVYVHVYTVSLVWQSVPGMCQANTYVDYTTLYYIIILAHTIIHPLLTKLCFGRQHATCAISKNSCWQSHTPHPTLLTQLSFLLWSCEQYPRLHRFAGGCGHTLKGKCCRARSPHERPYVPISSLGGETAFECCWRWSSCVEFVSPTLNATAT